MAYKVLLFGTDDLFNELKPFYDREVERGTFEVAGYALLEDGKVTIVDAAGKLGGGGTIFCFRAGDNFFATRFLSANEIFGGSRFPAQPNHRRQSFFRNNGFGFPAFGKRRRRLRSVQSVFIWFGFKTRDGLRDISQNLQKSTRRINVDD